MERPPREPSSGPSEPLRDPDFRRFWFGESVAMLGAQVSLLGIPLAAVLVLGATPLELGLLQAAAFVPFLLVVLPVGVWIDRVRRRPVLIFANLGRAVVLATVPVAALVGALSLPLLLLVAGAAGVLTVLFEVANQAYLPSLVAPERIGAANARLQASRSSAAIGGPGLAGLLVGVLGAPLALVVDAVSLAIAGTAIARIRRPEPRPESGPAVPLQRAVGEGVRFVLGQPMLRALAGEAGMFNLLWSGVEVAFLLYATADLGWDATTLGLAFSVGSIGSLIGSLGAGRIASRMGYGFALSLVMLLGTVPFAGLPFAVPGALGFLVVGASLFVGSVGVGGAVVLVVTLRQTAIPTELLGRATATYRLLTYGVIPIGAVLGGVLVEAVGARGALLVCTLGMALAPIWVLLSPLPRLRSIDGLRLERRPASVEGNRVAPGSVSAALETP